MEWVRAGNLAGCMNVYSIGVAGLPAGGRNDTMHAAGRPNGASIAVSAKSKS